MMRPTSLTVTTSGLSSPIPLDRYVNGYAVAVTMKTAGAQYTLQHSFDDPFQRWSVSMNTSATWFNSDDPVMVNASTNRASNYAFPPTACRINVTAKVSAGNPVTLTVIPMGALQ